MKTLSRLMLGIASAVVFAVLPAKADLAVYYSFTSNSSLTAGTAAWTNAILTADTGSSISSFTVNKAAGSFSLPLGSLLNVQPTPGTNTSAVSLDNWNNAGNYFQFTLDATSLSSISMSFWEQSSGTFTNSTLGQASVLLQYSTTGVGGTYTTFGSLTGSNVPGNVISFDLSAVTALNGDANDAFRLVADSTALPRSTGTFRIDNLTINAAVVPEPSTVMLVGIGLVGLFAVRRRRS